VKPGSGSLKTTKKKPAKKTAKRAAGKRGAASTLAAKAPAKRATSPKHGPRADLGAPVDTFFAKQPPELRVIVDELRALINAAAPKASSSLKWGMPFYTLHSSTLCAVAAFKSHVNLILPGPPGTYSDPQGLLDGDGKTGKHLKLRPHDELPRATIRAWLRVAATRARNESD
jgi:hypothetical protein